MLVCPKLMKIWNTLSIESTMTMLDQLISKCTIKVTKLIHLKRHGHPTNRTCLTTQKCSDSTRRIMLLTTKLNNALKMKIHWRNRAKRFLQRGCLKICRLGRKNTTTWCPATLVLFVNEFVILFKLNYLIEVNSFINFALLNQRYLLLQLLRVTTVPRFRLLLLPFLLDLIRKHFLVIVLLLLLLFLRDALVQGLSASRNLFAYQHAAFIELNCIIKLVVVVLSPTNNLKAFALTRSLLELYLEWTA